MLISTISQFRTAIRNGPYSWPGGYPMYFVMADGQPLSFQAAKKERRLILEALAHGGDKQWQVYGLEINWEADDLYCSHTNDLIESAYGEQVDV